MLVVNLEKVTPIWFKIMLIGGGGGGGGGGGLRNEKSSNSDYVKVPTTEMFGSNKPEFNPIDGGEGDKRQDQEGHICKERQQLKLLVVMKRLV